MKKFFLIVTLFVTTLCAAAQDKTEEDVDGKWILDGVTGLNISQTSFSNWSGGGENSLAGNIYLNGSLKRKSGNWLWVNTLALDYGLTKNKSDGMRKTNDKIDLSTQLGYSTDNKWFYTAMADLKTQFYKGYDYPNKDNYISKFFAPAYVNVSLGMEYRKDWFSVYLSPAAGKMTFVEDSYLSNRPGGSFGVDEGDRFKAELGAYLKGRLERTIMENVKVISTADFFTAYDDSFGNVDINWDVMISMKINKFLSASLNTTLKYDDDVKTYDSAGNWKSGAKVQFKEVLGIGLAYNF
ncbi:DUF3078 domain-containing protein [Dysgonomonas sp. 25]|uniref:DUF3078 domain-containing protein n=1 Tax=Dysgonomonas sp. 25 TaxID=2302933 RepID=UPI0013D39046|nr:DUF3078 domain-containing protein [Dysgonomonas sp. 25]NDV69733.1 DUF3078 domain-containing protein [Dysgonomonas sp. 25]